MKTDYQVDGMAVTLGERIKVLMDKRGITQSELARLCGISQSMISKIISGKRKPERSVLEKIALALGTTVDHLIGHQTGYAGERGRARRSGASGSLREIVSFSQPCAQRFAEAEVLAKRVFGEHVPLPFYTEHGEEHCRVLEAYLNEIIWPDEGHLGKYDFDPSPEEAMYLLSAVWLHDVGLWYGVFSNDRLDELSQAARVVELREEHESRTSRYIHEEWTGEDCGWAGEEKGWLANICVYHRRHHPIASFEPFKLNGRYTEGKVRLGALAGLLRLADACHVGKRRAPQKVIELYISLGMPGEARAYWERADLIRDVRFDHEERQIVLTGHYPRKFDFGLGRFDVREVGQMICDNVRRELRSVQQTLSHYSNTDLREVRHNPRWMPAIDYQQKRLCLQLWPYLLSSPFSPTEAAAALAQMLLLAAEHAEESGDLGIKRRKDICQIMNKTKKLRPHDFMIRNLCIGVSEHLAELPKYTKSAAKLKDYLTQFMNSIEKKCGSVVNHALGKIGPDDVLVLYGHSVKIERLLRHLDTNHTIYIVDCYMPLDGHNVSDENIKITQSVKKLGFKKYKFLQLASLAGALEELERKNIPCKLLLGTRGRLKCGDLLCKVGTRMITETAKQFGAQVIAFCETAKFLVDGVKDADIAGPDQLFSSEDEKMHPDLAGVCYVAPKTDRVPKELVDMVVTEKGVERKPLPARLPQVRAGPREKGE